MKILIATGSSGGHLFPALAYAEAMREGDGAEVQFLIAPYQTWKSPEALRAYKSHELSAFPLPRGLSLDWISFPFKLISNFFKIFAIVRRERPRLCVGFGSFVSFPLVLSAKILGIPVLIHEQNAVFGKANRLLRLIADRVALSFPLAQGQKRGNTVLTGNPIRKTLVESAKRSLYFPPKESDKLNVLVVGGSQGSRKLNNIFIEALKGLSQVEMTRFRVLHLTGSSLFDEVSQEYRELPSELEREVTPFSDDMPRAYTFAHWVVARAGAGTVFELAAFARPSLLVPYPHAESHQIENAKFLGLQGAAEFVEERELEAHSLRNRMRFVRENPYILKTMSENAGKLSILDAEDKLRRLSLELITSRQ